MRKIITCCLILISQCVLAAPSKKVLDIQHWTTSNGAKVYFVQAKQIPILDIQVAFHAGAARDGKQFGVAALTNELLAEGALGMTADQIAESFDAVGAKYASETAKDMAVVSLRSLTTPKLLNPALNTFIQLLAHPTFAEKPFKRQQHEQLMSIKQKYQSGDKIANDLFYQMIYANHPYGHPVLGVQETVSQLTPKDVKAFHHKYYVAKNAVIAMVGEIDRKQATDIAEKISKSLPAGEKPQVISQTPNLKQEQKEWIQFPSTQTNIRIGQTGISRKSADYFPLIVGNYILGGGAFVSRLTDEVREKRGLSYTVYSQFIPMQVKGPFLISLGTANANAEKALAITSKTLKDFITAGPTEGELAAAKSNITGGFALRLDSNKAIVGTLIYMAFYDLPLDYLDTYRDKTNAVTVAEIKKAFQKHLHPDRMVIVSVGKQVKKS